MCVCALGHVRLFATPWAIAYQAPLSREFSKEEYWSRLPFPSPGDLPDPGIEPEYLEPLLWSVDSLPVCCPGNPGVKWRGINSEIGIDTYTKVKRK